MKEPQIITLIIEAYGDRENLTAILARSGYKVWQVEKEGVNSWDKKLNCVCFELSDKK